MEFKNETNDTINGLISAWQEIHKSMFSNFFGLQSNCSYEYYETDHTFIIRRKEFDFYRIYLLSDSKTELQTILCGLDDGVYVFNIPTKKTIDEWDEILKNGGFEYFETYSKMCNTKFVTMKHHQTEGTDYAKHEELKQIQDFMKNSFSPYTSHVPELSELEEYQKCNTIRVERSRDGKICGLMIYSVVGTTATSLVWASNGEHGMDLYFDMYNYFLEKGAKRFLFWVRDTNIIPYKLYVKYGAVPMGVKDYTYVKRNN